MSVIAKFICEELLLEQQIMDTPSARAALKKMGITEYPYTRNYSKKEYHDLLEKWYKTVNKVQQKQSSISLDGLDPINHDIDQLV
nr:MAG TPA: hypothetical protein [Caudoviricetes sp.]